MRRLKPFLRKAEKNLRKYALPVAFLSGLLIAGLVAVIIPKIQFPTTLSFPSLTGANYAEVGELTGVTWSFQEYSTYFQKLAEKKGAEYAFEVLKRAPLANGTDLHLLGHVVGDMLYEQEGIEGIKTCTPDFRNACSHSVVIGILNKEGEGSLPKIVETCKEAPGGRGAYSMCFHGLGHGVLAFTGYNLERAVNMCKGAGTPDNQNREYIECVGGTIMEMIAGVHDPIAWASQKDTYFKESDPLSPCNADFMPDEVRGICYVHLTPHLFTAAGGNLGNIDAVIFPKAFSYCSLIPESERGLRSACYSGFGKEFTVIAQGRDVRNMGATPEPALKNVRDWCGAAGNAYGEGSCHSSALASLFWGGENNPDASFTYCAIGEGVFKDECYTQLAQHIRYYLEGKPEGKKLCARLPEEYQNRCNVASSQTR